MSVLEIVLYSLLATGFALFVVLNIISEVRKKKKGQKEDEEED